MISVLAAAAHGRGEGAGAPARGRGRCPGSYSTPHAGPRYHAPVSDGPDFLGIGAQKAGTSWLHANLAQHPRVRFPGGKELHFWDREHARGMAWYRTCFSGAAPGVLQGDITPAYAILSAELVAEIAREFPGLRLYLLLRDPVERAWSSARMALARAEMEPDEASDAWYLDHFRSRGSRARGDYATVLDRWLAVFPRDALLVLRHERIAAEPDAVARAACAHLGLDPAPLLAESNAWLRARVREGERAELRPALRAALEDLYAEPLRRLREEHDIEWRRP